MMTSQNQYSWSDILIQMPSDLLQSINANSVRCFNLSGLISAVGDGRKAELSLHVDRLPLDTLYHQDILVHQALHKLFEMLLDHLID